MTDEIIIIEDMLPERYEFTEPQFYNGKNTYELYLLYTTDNPVLSPGEWIGRMKGTIVTVGPNENWWIDGVDTGVLARGTNGQTPIIGENGNWWIGGVDTGYNAVAVTEAYLLQTFEAKKQADELYTNAAEKALVATINDKINRSETLTATEIQLLISNLVDSSPESLNTLNELAAALGDDPNFGTTITNLIAAKVTAVAGYSLTKNDLTDLLKASYDDAVTKKHTHTNKAVLDATEQSFTSALKTSYDNAVTAVEGIETLLSEL